MGRREIGPSFLHRRGREDAWEAEVRSQQVEGDSNSSGAEERREAVNCSFIMMTCPCGEAVSVR